MRPAVRRRVQEGRVSEERKALIRRLLLERLGLRAIARVAGVSSSWLQGFVNAVADYYSSDFDPVIELRAFEPPPQCRKDGQSAPASLD